MAKLLYTIAKNEQGLFIKANEAEKGNDFFCPVCSSDLILRKSGNTGKGAKRPHFAHKSLTPNCTPETAVPAVQNKKQCPDGTPVRQDSPGLMILFKGD